MRVKKMRKLSAIERATLLAVADRMGREVDGELAALVRRVASGDDSALLGAVDRLKEVGRDEDGERLKKLVLR